MTYNKIFKSRCSMNKKSLFIFILCFLLIFVGFLVFINSENSNTVSVGDSNFKLPEGYKEGTLNSYNDVNITNGTNSFFIVEYNTTDINECLDHYKKYCHDKNLSVKIDSFSINDKAIFESKLSNDTKNVHYWFMNNNKVYSIYSWSSNSEMKNDIIKLITS